MLKRMKADKDERIRIKDEFSLFIKTAIATDTNDKIIPYQAKTSCKGVSRQKYGVLKRVKILVAT